MTDVGRFSSWGKRRSVTRRARGAIGSLGKTLRGLRGLREGRRKVTWLSVVLIAGLAPQWAAAQAVGAPSDVGREHTKDRHEWKRGWYGREWSQRYRRFLFGVGQRQSWLHPRSLTLAQSTLRATELRPAPLAGVNWSNLGPSDGGPSFDAGEGNQRWVFRPDAVDSGRVNQVVAHPRDKRTVFVVSAEGGLWRTTDAGASWVPLTEALPSLALGSMAIDPAQPTTMYVGLGDVEEANFGGTGVGIVKSVDTGKTWSDAVVTGNATVVTALLVDPTASATVFAGTNAGLFRSTDEGKTFAPVTLPAGGASTVRDIICTGPGHFVLAVGNNFEGNLGDGNANIVYSRDGGATWSASKGLGPRAGIRRFSLAAAPSDRRRLYALAADVRGELHEIYRSRDAGVTWIPTKASVRRYTRELGDRATIGTLLGGQGGYNQIAVVSPQNPDIVFFGGNLNLVRSADAGLTYTILTDWAQEGGLPYVHPDFHSATFDGEGALWVGTDGGVAKSTDGGINWSTAENRGLATHLVYSVGSSAEAPDVVIGGFQDNGCRVRSGITHNFPQRVYADGFGVVAHSKDRSRLLASVYQTRILKSTDGGASFHGSYAGIPEAGVPDAAPFYTRLAAWSGDPSGDTVLTFTNRQIYRSEDFAATWLPLPSPQIAGVIRQLGLAATTRDVLGVVTGTGWGGGAGTGKVYLTSNGGSSWHAAAPLPGSAGALSYISFHPRNAKRIYVASVAPGKSATHAWKSDNEGNQWTPIDAGTGFPKGVPVNIILADPGDDNTIYAGTHLGLYRSVSNGNSWTRIGAGLPLVSVTDLWIAPDSSFVRVATFGRGIWELLP